MAHETPDLDAAVLLARCCDSGRQYGIRVEARNGDWVCTWAFPIDNEARASRERYGERALSGTFAFVDEWPGCSRCGAKSWVRCSSCGRIGCYRTQTDYSCPWCSANITFTNNGSGGGRFQVDSLRD